MTAEISLVDHRNDPVARTIEGTERGELLQIYKNSVRLLNSKAQKTLDKFYAILDDGSALKLSLIDNTVFLSDTKKESLDYLSDKNWDLGGSSPFIKFYADPILRENFDKRTINFDDAGIMQENNPQALRGIYMDLDLGLYSKGSPNAYHAKNIDKELRAIGWDGKMPVRVDGVETIEDKKAAEGLTFKVGENTVWRHAPYLSHGNNGKQFNRFSADGIEFSEGGKYTLYVVNSGLVGFCLYWLGYLGCDDLWDSDPAGRVFDTKVAKPLAKNKSK